MASLDTDNGSAAAAAAAAASIDHSPLSVVWKVWKEFDLDSMRVRLDESGMQIAAHQEEAVQNRRKLAEATREFKKTAAEAASKPVGALLKLYQEEIDRLTKRAKHGEGAFLDIYQKLYEAPDPSSTLANAFETASRAADLEAQVRKLGSELAEYKAESTQIKNQDHSIRKLEEKIRALEAELQERAGELVEAKEAAVAEADAARLAQMQEREAELSAALNAAHTSLATMQKLHASTQNQLFAIQSQSEEERVGRQSEVEFAAAELERAQERLAALEREKARLEARATAEAADATARSTGTGNNGVAAQGSSSGGGLGVEEALRSELCTQRELSARLRSEVASLRRELEQNDSMWGARVEGLRSALQATEQHTAALEDELAVRPTNGQMEELRQQLRVLQAIGYSSLELDDGEAPAPTTIGGSAGSAGGSGHGGVGSLEAALLQRNRHLEHELTMSKLRAVDSRQELEKMLASMAELEAQVTAKTDAAAEVPPEEMIRSMTRTSVGHGMGQGLEAADRQALINRLEEDLLSARTSDPVDSTDKAGGTHARDASGSKLTGLIGGDDQDGDSSMVRVVCGQRDRLRAKVHELEEEITRCRVELLTARNEASAAKADNMALVERLRYVHGYKQQQQKDSAGPDGVLGGLSNSKSGDVEAGVSVERKYGRLYDEGINPFREFQGGERDRQKKQMGVPDKVMYMFGQLVFGSVPARLFVFAYLAIMHLLVFASLTRMTHHSSGQLYEHQQSVIDSSHNDMTQALQHGDTAVQAAMDALSPASRLPSR